MLRIALLFLSMALLSGCAGFDGQLASPRKEELWSTRTVPLELSAQLLQALPLERTPADAFPRVELTAAGWQKVYGATLTALEDAQVHAAGPIDRDWLDLNISWLLALQHRCDEATARLRVLASRQDDAEFLPRIADGMLESGSANGCDVLFGGQVMPTVTAKPRYPVQALRACWSSWVRVGALVAPDGRVRKVYVLSSSLRGFEQSALNAVAQYQFPPGPHVQLIVQSVQYKVTDCSGPALPAATTDFYSYWDFAAYWNAVRAQVSANPDAVAGPPATEP